MSVSGKKKNENDVITCLCFRSNQSLKNTDITLIFGFGISYIWFSYIYSCFFKNIDFFWGGE